MNTPPKVSSNQAHPQIKITSVILFKFYVFYKDMFFYNNIDFPFAFLLFCATKKSIMKITYNQNTINDIHGCDAVFMPYSGQDRCNRCILADSDNCADAPCSEEERKDGRRGYFRASKTADTPYSVAAGFTV